MGILWGRSCANRAASPVLAAYHSSHRRNQASPPTSSGLGTAFEAEGDEGLYTAWDINVCADNEDGTGDPLFSVDEDEGPGSN